jgi:hypothetical protein
MTSAQMSHYILAEMHNLLTACCFYNFNLYVFTIFRIAILFRASLYQIMKNRIDIAFYRINAQVLHLFIEKIKSISLESSACKIQS